MKDMKGLCLVAVLLPLALAAALPGEIVFTDAFAKRGWMTWGPHGYAPVTNRTMSVADGRIYLSDPAGMRTPVPSPVCREGARIRFRIEAKCPDGCRLGVFAYRGKECVRLWGEKNGGGNDFGKLSFETSVPAPVDSIRCAIEGRGEYRRAALEWLHEPGVSLLADPAYQMSADGTFAPVRFTLYRGDEPVDSSGATVHGLSAFDPATGATAEAIAEKGDPAPFEKLAADVKLANPISILYLGDSLTHFDFGRNHADKTAYFLGKANPGKVRMFNYAVRGDHIRTVMDRMGGNGKGAYAHYYDDLWSRRYDWAFVLLGHNDTKATSQSNYTRTTVAPDVQEGLYRDLVARLKEKGVKRIVLMSSTSSNFEICAANARKAKGNHNRFGEPKHMEAFNAVVKRVAADTGVEFLDLYTPMKARPDKASLVRPTDGVHLTDAGHDFVVQETLRFLGR